MLLWKMHTDSKFFRQGEVSYDFISFKIPKPEQKENSCVSSWLHAASASSRGCLQ